MSRLHTPRAGMPLKRALFHAASRILFVLALALAALGGALFTAPRAAHADSSSLNGGAIWSLPGSDGVDRCQAHVLSANDDGSTAAVPLGFTLNFFGNTHSAAFVNNNGNITFDSPLSTYTPFDLRSTTHQIIAPFFGDVDTRGTGSSPVTYSYGDATYNGHAAFCVDWVNVGYYAAHADKLNSFQVVLVDRSDTGDGNFDIYFNYDQIQWETGDASGGTGGLGGNSARVGYSNGTTASFELPGSAVNGAFLDSNPGGLVHGSRNSSQLGRYLFSVRNGVAPTGGSISGRVFAHSNDPANVLGGAFVQVCGTGGGCNTTLTDANGSYTVSGLSDDSYTVTAFPPGGSTLFHEAIGPLAIAGANDLTNEDVVLPGPAPLPNGTTITNRYVDSSGVPVIYWQSDLDLTTHGCAGGTASYRITLADGTLASSGALTEGPAGTYTAHISQLYPNHGDAHVSIVIDCPDSTTTNTDFDVYIDPSGNVVDDTTNAGIQGATVTLLHSDTSSGPFTPVVSGSTLLSFTTSSNPETSDSAGHYGWDVAAGYYKVQAFKAGYGCPVTLPSGFNCVTDGAQQIVESNVLTIPPAVTDLTLPLHSLDTGGSGGGTGGGTDTPELGSGELLATGLLPILGVVLYRRRQSRRVRNS